MDEVAGFAQALKSMYIHIHTNSNSGYLPRGMIARQAVVKIDREREEEPPTYRGRFIGSSYVFLKSFGGDALAAAVYHFGGISFPAPALQPANIACVDILRAEEVISTCRCIYW